MIIPTFPLGDPLKPGPDPADAALDQLGAELACLTTHWGARTCVIVPTEQDRDRLDVERTAFADLDSQAFRWLHELDRASWHATGPLLGQLMTATSLRGRVFQYLAGMTDRYGQYSGGVRVATSIVFLAGGILLVRGGGEVWRVILEARSGGMHSPSATPPRPLPVDAGLRMLVRTGLGGHGRLGLTADVTALLTLMGRNARPDWVATTLLADGVHLADA